MENPVPSGDFVAAASGLVRLGIPLVALTVAALFVVGVARAAKAARPDWRGVALKAAVGSALWLAILAGLGLSGVLLRFDLRPPPLMLMLAATIALAVYVARSRIGSDLALRLPLAALVGSQAFRLPLELVMHRAASDGVMPVQMSYSGYNFDIVTGASAALLGLWLYFGKPPLWVMAAWNAVGFVLLVTIGAVAIAATPLFLAFGPDHPNVWVAYFPYVWLPGVLVGAALLGHVLVLRRLLNERKSRDVGAPGLAAER